MVKRIFILRAKFLITYLLRMKQNYIIINFNQKLILTVQSFIKLAICASSWSNFMMKVLYRLIDGLFAGGLLCLLWILFRFMS